eukprot:gene11391-13950_t
MDDDVSNDPKNKQFNDELNSVLMLFSKSGEWADFVKCLMKLIKVFEKYPKSSCIQSKLTISKRLSQCLNPSLPAGCHIKALETYETIFNRIGLDKLSRDLAIYATGLFPLFHLASTDVRFKVLQLYEKYILPLNLKLTPCLNGVVSSLLPGLEEGQGEIYELVLKLLDNFCKSTSTTLFYQAIWKSLIITPYNRLSAINYLLNRLPKDIDGTNQIMYLPEKDTLVAQALSESLLDSNILVQRNMLELLTVYFSISSNIFSETALETIIKAAIMVVTHRDMSLNRRLYSWLLGTSNDNNSSKDNNSSTIISTATNNTEYFIKYGMKSTINAFKVLFSKLSTVEGVVGQSNQVITLPYKILIYFFQKEEFQSIIEFLMPDILRCLYLYKDGYSFSKDIIGYTDQVLETISDNTVIWKFFTKLLSATPADNSGDSPVVGENNNNNNTIFNNSISIENVKLVECVLDIIPLSVEEVQTHFLPELLLVLIQSLKTIMMSRDNQLIISYTRLSLKIIGKIIVDTSLPHSQEYLINSIETYQDYFAVLSEYIHQNISLLVSQSQSSTTTGSGSIYHPTLPSLSTNNNNLNTLSNPIAFTPISSFSFITNSDIFTVLDLSLQMLIGLFSQFKTSPASPQSSPQLESIMPKWFFPIFSFCTAENPFISCLAIRAFISMANKHGESNLSRSFRNIITTDHFQTLVKKLWALLDPNNCAVHYKVASLFLSLWELNEDACSGVISEAMLDSNLNNRIEGYQKFALLWRLTGELGNSSLPFSNTLFLMLDSLYDDQPIIRLTGHTWLADSISKAERILDPLLKILLDKTTIRFNHFYQSIYDTRRVIYVFKILKAIIECDFKLFIQHVIEKPISKDILQLNEGQTMNFRESPKTGAIQFNNNNNTSRYTSPESTTTTQFNSKQQFPAEGGPSQETSSDFLFIPTNSYIDLMVVSSLRFLQGQVPLSLDQSTKDGQTFVAQNNVVQICAAEFLQYLLAKTSIQPTKAHEIANNIQEPILQNLAQAVSSCNMVLQVHLLSLLRSIVLIDSSTNSTSSTSGSSGSTISTPSFSSLSSTPLDSSSSSATGSAPLTSITQTQMFLQTTVVGLIQPSSRFNIRFYWLDFITFCLPRMANSVHLPNFVLTIVNCLRDLLISFDSRSLYDSLTSRDIIVILKSLTFILKFSVLEPSTPFDKSLNEESPANKGSALGVRMFDFVKDVFTSEIDNSTSLTPIGQVRNDIFNVLADIIAPLLRIWGPPRSTSTKMSISTDVSYDTHNKFAIQDLIIHILDPFMSKYPTQLISSIVEIWQRTDISSNDISSVTSRKVVMEIISSLESVKEDSLFTAAHQILANLHAQERTKAPKLTIHKITMKESALYDFLYRYIEDYPTPFDGVSTPFLQFVRESLHSSNPMTFVSQLQILNVYTKKLVSDEKTKNPNRSKFNKRELQDLLPKIIDACFMISGKSFNDISAMYIPPISVGGPTSSTSSSSTLSMSGGASGGSMNYSLLSASTSLSQLSELTNGPSSRPTSLDLRSTPTTDSTSILQTPPSAYTSTSTSIEDTQQNRTRASSGGEHAVGDHPPASLKKEASRLKTQVSLKSLVNLSSILASLLDSILDDKERIATLLANSLHNVVPYMKSKFDISRDNNYYATCLFASLSEFPYNLKSIKKDALELFFDQDFFKSDIKTLEQSSRFINQIMTHDKTALADFTKVLGRNWNPSSALMFVNKDAENLNRARQLKRLSFIIWSGTENQHLSILPIVQEKIVESLRIQNATVLHLQVFFCLRILLIRITHNNLRSFWPIILTEIIDILSHAENYELILAACKFLDLALTIPVITEQFSLVEWVFLKDCFIKHSNQDPPFLPFVDQISQKPLSSTSVASSTIVPQLNNIDIGSFQPFVLTPSGEIETRYNSEHSRPTILIRSISDLSNGFIDFRAFLSKFSTLIYHRHLKAAPIDYNFINDLLIFDFCEMEKFTPDFIANLEKRHQRLLQKQLQQQQQMDPTNNSQNHHWTRSHHSPKPSSSNIIETTRSLSISNGNESNKDDDDDILSNENNVEINQGIANVLILEDHQTSPSLRSSSNREDLFSSGE